MWWEIKQNLPYMKEIGVENIKHFQEFLFFLAFWDSNNEISRSLLNTHMTKVVLGFRLSSVCVLLLHFFFFHAFCFRGQLSLFMHCSRTVHVLFMGSTTTLFIKKILKMGPTVLFTHLKIILLQCFQFSVSATINSIQTDPKCQIQSKLKGDTGTQPISNDRLINLLQGNARGFFTEIRKRIHDSRAYLP